MIEISALQIDRLRFRLPSPVAITGHTLLHQEHLIVRLFSADGGVGWGEAAPFKPITGDSDPEVLREAASLEIADFPLLENPVEFYDRVLARIHSPTLRAALDFAAYDLVGKARSTPCYRLLSDRRFAVPNSVTVFLQDAPEQSQSVAMEILRLYPELQILKIKLCGSDDLERCRAIKAVTPAHLRFVLDANQGFHDPGIAVAELGKIVALLGDVLLVEEPCPKGDLEKMQYVRKNLQNTLVFADESCRDERDLDLIIREKAADGINIKLQKSGGITPAKRLVERAQASGIKIMLGQMFESPLATSASVHFATATAGVMLTDLDMDLPFPDSLAPKASFYGGVRTPLSTPGIGSFIDQSSLKKLAIEQQVEFEPLLEVGV